MKEAKHIDVSAVLAAGPSAVEQAHLAQCAVCRTEWEAAQAQFAQLRTVDASLANVPDSFWEAQRRNIRVHAAEAQPVTVRYERLAWVAAAIAVVAGSLSLVVPHAGHRVPPAPPAQVQSTDEISDAALIRSVQEDLESYPEALHPAQVMYVEMSSASAPAKRK